MKITRVDARLVRLPAVEPLANGPVPPGLMRDVMALQVATTDGITGIGFACFPGYYAGNLSLALKIAVEHFGSLAAGEDPLRPEAVAQKIRAATAFAGPPGIATIALAAIDIALWDIKGKVAGVPLASLVGGHRDRVAAYASGALMRGYPLEHVVTAAKKLADGGYRQLKMQLGLGTGPEREVERVTKVREAIGADIELMCDINQKWGVQEAIAIGRRIEDLHLSWLEDVTAFDDYAGQARVADALATPVAGGEYVFGIVPFRHMLEARSVDIVMIDLLRVGGVTQWLKVAAMAEAFNVPVISHIMPEISMHLVAGVPNGLTVEYIPWGGVLFADAPKVVNGEFVIRDRPGLGLSFNEEVIARYGVK